MANHKSAAKRARQAVRRQASNRNYRSQVHSSIRAVEEAVAKKDAKAAAEALRAAQPHMARAASKGAIPKKRMSRKLSRLAAQVKRAKQA
jgi:small subunit ribosomal protein S20